MVDGFQEDGGLRAEMKTEQEIQRTHDYLIQKHVDEIHRLIHQLDVLLEKPEEEAEDLGV